MSPQQFTPKRVNPFADVLAGTPATWSEQLNMPVVNQFGAKDTEIAARLGIIDLSWRLRTGCKGPGSATWLEAAGVPIPAQANTFIQTQEGAVVVRLGRNEFLIEDVADAVLTRQLREIPAPAGAYTVLRQDAELMLTGSEINDFLLQTCSFDFAGIDQGAAPAIMTTMVGVGVTAIQVASPRKLDGHALRIWFDSSYADYMWSTFCEIAGELGGGAAGITVLN
jgi:sarcosine oxidase, subunit gamma